MNWPMVPLGDLADTALGKMLDRGKHRGYPLVPYLRNVNVQWGRIDRFDLKQMELAEDEWDRFAVKPGDLLVCEGGEIGRAAIWNGHGDYIAYQKALHRVRPGGSLDSQFLLYLLEYYSGNGVLASLSTGSTIAHLPQQKLRVVPVPLAPIDKQRRVVQFLESEFSKIARAAIALERATSRIRALEASALERHFANPSAGVPLGELTTNIEAGRSFGSASGPASDSQWGLLKVSAMTRGEFNPLENKAVAGERADPRFEVREGDLLLSRANTSEYVGASVLVGPVRPRLLLSDKSLRLTPRSGVMAGWLWRALQTPSARRQISALATGTKDSMRNISQESLRRVILPDVDQQAQTEALQRFEGWKAALTSLEREIARGKLRLAALRRSLLTTAFSGSLAPSAEAERGIYEVGA